MQKIKITFLLDKKNNWIESYLLSSVLFRNSSAHAFKISHDPLNIQGQDIVFILGYTKILNEEFLKSNALNLVVHESALPKGKGFAPVQWQILEGAKSIPVYLLEAANKVDSGDIVYKDAFELTGYELYGEIREKQAKATLEIIRKFLDIYPNFTREKQIGTETFYPKRAAKDSELDINKNIKQQFNLLRIANNEEWPSFFYYEGKKYLLKIYAEDSDQD